MRVTFAHPTTTAIALWQSEAAGPMRVADAKSRAVGRR